MSTGTSLIEVKQALVTRFTARAGLAGVQVSYAFPVTFVKGEDIWFGAATSELQIPVMRGAAAALRVDEDYRLTVHIQALKTQGEGQEAADVRAAELLREVQQELATNTQPAGVLLAELVGWEHFVGPFDGSGTTHGSRFDTTVRVRARLT